MLDRHDRVAFYTPAALRLIEGLRETWQPEAPGKIQLPTAVWSAVARVRAPHTQATRAAVCVKSCMASFKSKHHQGAIPALLLSCDA